MCDALKVHSRLRLKCVFLSQTNALDGHLLREDLEEDLASDWLLCAAKCSLLAELPVGDAVWNTRNTNEGGRVEAVLIRENSTEKEANLESKENYCLGSLEAAAFAFKSTERWFQRELRPRGCMQKTKRYSDRMLQTVVQHPTRCTVSTQHPTQRGHGTGSSYLQEVIMVQGVVAHVDDCTKVTKHEKQYLLSTAFATNIYREARTQTPAKALALAVIFARGNRAGRCRLSAAFLGVISFTTYLLSSVASHSPRFTLIGSQELDIKSRNNHSTALGSPLFVEQRRNARAVETGDPRVNPPTRGIVRHDFPVIGYDNYNCWATVFTVLFENKAPENAKKNQENTSPEDSTHISFSAQNHAGRTDLSIERHRNARVRETGDPRENPPISGTVWHFRHVRKSGSDPTGNQIQFALFGEECSSRCRPNDVAVPLTFVYQLSDWLQEALEMGLVSYWLKLKTRQASRDIPLPLQEGAGLFRSVVTAAENREKTTYVYNASSVTKFPSLQRRRIGRALLYTASPTFPPSSCAKIIFSIELYVNLASAQTSQLFTYSDVAY
ncbi:hypothetical protein PR048_018080 [Dryococelus australis]|uniref:Uncharacterized protein n=1 Tax=Dryococelus australis TaxID=614101 RepID=A0ABQ9HBA6_9NEOP|nr:hypothetical protein PR048_018080 [Dryococelus australis]